MDSLAAVDWAAYEQEALSAISGGDLEEARVRYLGRRSELAQALRGVRDRESGMLLNGVKTRLEAAVAAPACGPCPARAKRRPSPGLAPRGPPRSWPPPAARPPTAAST